MLVNQTVDTIRDVLIKKRTSLWSLYRAKKQSWKQKSRVKWILEGDRNTKFFHLMASTRKRGNFIDNLSVHGVVIDSPRDLKTAIADHFEKHFQSRQAIKLKDWHYNLRSLNESSVRLLERPFSEEEVWNVIQRSDGNKAPGPDGFNMHFIKSHWSLFKEEVMLVFDLFFSSGTLDCRLNSSFIVLIPKCHSPSGLNDYRPISLVGCIYKLVAKMLAHRLRLVIKEVIGPNQFAFVTGRQILDCSLVANEVIDEIKKKGMGGLLCKVDFEKAYDSVEWSFLDWVMAKMGFGERWRKWILGCVSTASISVLVNGSPSRQFRISRGLRQGCPLSPFLLISWLRR